MSNEMATKGHTISNMKNRNNVHVTCMLEHIIQRSVQNRVGSMSCLAYMRQMRIFR